MSDRVESMAYPEDPERCQGMSAQGQCRNKGVRLPDGKCGPLCMVHGGRAAADSYNQEALRNYRLTKFQAQFARHASSSQIKNLRDEIGILRMMLEEKLNQCSDTTDLILQSGAISDLVIKIEKLVSSCHKLEGSMGQLLDKQMILQFASEIVTEISEEIQEADRLERITSRILKLIGRIGEDESIRDIDG